MSKHIKVRYGDTIGEFDKHYFETIILHRNGWVEGRSEGKNEHYPPNVVEEVVGDVVYE